MGTPVTINATEHLFQSTTTYDRNGVALRVENIFHTTDNATGAVVAVRSAPVVFVKDVDLDATKTLAQIPALAETKKTADDAAKVAEIEL